MNKFKLNKQGVGELLKSPEMGLVMTEYAKDIQSRCGEGFIVTLVTGRQRVVASVYANTVESRQKNLKENILLKAVEK